MSISREQIALPKQLLNEAARHADTLGISTTRWIEKTLTDRLRLEEETAAFFRERASRATGRTLTELLSNAPDVPPMLGDELEA